MKTARKVLLIVSFLIYAIYTTFMVYLIIDAKLQPEVPEGDVDLTGLGNALVFIVFILLIGSIVYTINTIVSIVGWVFSRKLSNDEEKVSSLPFKIMTFIPYVTEVILIVIYLLMLK